MKLEAGKYYKTRDARKVGPMVRNTIGDKYWTAPTVFDEYGPYWCENGKFHEGEAWPIDLISEWPDEGPIRTVTRREIVPGTYGVVRVDKSVNGYVFDLWKANADAAELREAAHIFNQLAEVLDDV